LDFVAWNLPIEVFMSPVRFLFAFLVVTISTLAIRAEEPIKVEVEILGGKTVKGDLTSIDATEVTVKTETGVEKIPVKEVLAVNMNRQAKALPKQYALAELTDGTKLYCESIGMKKDVVLLKLTNGASVEAPMKLVKYVLRDAHDEAVMKKWEALLQQRTQEDRNFDCVVIATYTGSGTQEKLDKLNGIPGTIGGEEDGQLDFLVTKTGKKSPVEMSHFQALIFNNGPPPGAKPPIFKLNDVDGNFIPVAKLAAKGTGYAVETVGGVKMETPFASMVKLDFRIGNLRYLSEPGMEPSKSETISNLLPDPKYVKLFEPVKDKVKSPTSSELLPIRMKGITYKQGLSVHAKTELIYPVKGEYEWFSAVVGFSDDVGGLSVPVIIEIYGDGKLLKTLTLNHADYKQPEELKILIKDVDRLIIKVRSGGLLDSGWVELGDAMVNK